MSKSIYLFLFCYFIISTGPFMFKHHDLYMLTDYMPYEEAQYDVNFFKGRLANPADIISFFDSESFYWPYGTQKSVSFVIGGKYPLQVHHNDEYTAFYDPNGKYFYYQGHIDYIMNVLPFIANGEIVWFLDGDTLFSYSLESNCLKDFILPGPPRFNDSTFNVIYHKWYNSKIITAIDFYELSDDGNIHCSDSISIESFDEFYPYYGIEPTANGWIVFSDETIIYEDRMIKSRIKLGYSPSYWYYYGCLGVEYFVIGHLNQFEVYEIVRHNNSDCDIVFSFSGKTEGFIGSVSGNGAKIFVSYDSLEETSYLVVWNISTKQVDEDIQIPSYLGLCSKVVPNDEGQYIMLCSSGYLIGEMGRTGFIVEEQRMEGCIAVHVCGNYVYIAGKDGELYQLKRMM